MFFYIKYYLLLYIIIKTVKTMKTLIVNRTNKGGVLIRKSDNSFQNEYSSQSLNWWVNNEIPFYISIGYKIDIRDQYYNSSIQKFI